MAFRVPLVIVVLRYNAGTPIPLNYARAPLMTTNYDPIAEQYQRSKQQPWRTFIECFTLMTFRKYGFDTSVRGEWQEGVPIRWTFHLSDGAFEIENYHLNVTIHEEAFRQAAFREVRWHAPRLSPEGLIEYDQAFWSSLLDHPPVAFIECVK